MALLRSGRRTSVSSGLSSASVQSWKSARAASPNIQSSAEGSMIRHTKRVRKALSSEGSVEEGRSSFPTVRALMDASDEALKKILIEGKHKVRCPFCNALGTLSPVGKAGSAGFRRWKCGARVGEHGCRKTCAQVIVFGDVLGAGNPRAWASVAPIKLTRRINLLEIYPTQKTVPRPHITKKCEAKPEVSADKNGTNVSNLLKE